MSSMQSIQVHLAERCYPIHIGEGLLASQELLQQYIRGQQVLLISNETVSSLYLEQVSQNFSNYQLDIMILPDGENYKTLAVVSDIFDLLLEKGHRRNTTIIALGGGVIGDIAGFAAACYQRGVGFIQLPTSLLAQVDAAIGGKTAINHKLGKNMIGAFYQPQCVIIDVSTLKTLPLREFRSGLAEVVKYGLLASSDFYQWLIANMDSLLRRDIDCLREMVATSCSIKAQIVVEDEKDQGKRALLNLGHTFAHAIESWSNYSADYLHGESVAVGLMYAARLSERLGYISTSDVVQLKAILSQLGLPVNGPAKMSVDDYLTNMVRDKKQLSQKLRLVLLKSVGEAFVCEGVPIKELTEILSGD